MAPILPPPARVATRWTNPAGADRVEVQGKLVAAAPLINPEAQVVRNAAAVRLVSPIAGNARNTSRPMSSL
ncbi:hypothetical protein GCM10023317_29910 [Actinopolymorpha pittospori]